MEEMYTDEIGRCFCDQHRREVCHECGYAFDEMNRDREEDAGLRKPRTELERAAEFFVVCNTALKRMEREMGIGPGDPVYEQNRQHQIEALQKWNALKKEAKPEKANEAMRKALDKETTKMANLHAVQQAWARQNPGKRVMEYGGPETQQLFDQFAAPPPSASQSKRADKHTCSFCGKVSVERLECCSICKQTFYCNRKCQTKAWKAHKNICQPADKQPKSLKMVSWAQVEANKGQPVSGKTLEVRAIEDQSLTRQVFQCKDRAGVVNRVAAYTDSRMIPGLKQGAILRWKNPRFHFFMDGSKGARIEEEDLADLTVSES